MTGDEIRKRTRTHLIAYAIILALSLGAAALVLAGKPSPVTVMAISAIQVVVVLTAMMHATSEGPWVRWLLVFAALFVASMAGLFILGKHDKIQGTEIVIVRHVEPGAAAGKVH